jgi:hypothetical protein
MFKIENGIVYKHDKGESYELWEPFGQEYRVAEIEGLKSWERFDLDSGVYVPAPECTDSFPKDPVLPESQEIRIAQLEAENATLKERQAITESALNDLIDITLGGGL